MKGWRDILRQLEAPPGGEPEITQEDIAEAAAVLLEYVMPSVTALEMVKREAIERGLPEDVADDLVRALARKITEAM